MITLKEKDIIHIMMGATLLAGGGGGSLADGMELVDTYKHNYPEKEMSCDLYSVEEMEEGKYTIGLAVMGSPVEGGKVDATNCIITAYERSKDLGAITGQTPDYTLSMELGGFNTFTPILISMIEGIPMVDADCAGRAVPGLETAISHINGLPTGPFVMGSIGGDAFLVEPKDPYDAVYCQRMAIPIVQMFEQNAGMAGWMYNKKQLQECVPEGTITLSMRVGEIMEEYQKNPEGSMFDKIREAGLGSTRTLLEQGCICNYTPQPGVTGNNDVGYYEVKENPDSSVAYRIHYANESLVLEEVTASSVTPLATVPSIITMYDYETGHPLTNEDITLAHENHTLDKLRVTLGLIRVDEKWWKNAETMRACWTKYFEEIGYQGDIQRFL
ncbi:MAG: DUF917 family protein [Lachnospiraceae bacterium]|nr:DUF917 family protein [Lachnospiraceae bacterium]